MGLVLLIIILAGIAAGVYYYRNKRVTGMSEKADSPNEIQVAERQYARGEISKEELERIRKDVE